MKLNRFLLSLAAGVSVAISSPHTLMAETGGQRVSITPEASLLVTTDDGTELSSAVLRSIAQHGEFTAYSSAYNTFVSVKGADNALSLYNDGGRTACGSKIADAKGTIGNVGYTAQLIDINLDASQTAGSSSSCAGTGMNCPLTDCTYTWSLFGHSVSEDGECFPSVIISIPDLGNTRTTCVCMPGIPIF